MSARRTVKCVVWDLDNTLWDGVLLEGDRITVRDDVVAAIRELDGRGILHSIASRNDPAVALEMLRTLGLDDLFVHPQISWGAKSESVAAVARALNIGTDALAFVDDDPFERDEVAAGVPGVLCVDAAEAARLPDRPELIPRVVTDDARQRRAMIQAEIARAREEGMMAPGEFLASLGMVFTIAEAGPRDLPRVEELTVRTNQLNSTGRTFGYEELEKLRRSPSHLLLVAGLDDRYGSYGKIGLAVVELAEEAWLLHLLLMSCRVMARGVGKVMLAHILCAARSAGLPVRATFVRTERNRPMYLTFKLAGFREVEREGNVAVLEHDLALIEPFPAHVDVRVVGAKGAVSDAA